jgi:hypothetical protein
LWGRGNPYELLRGGEWERAQKNGVDDAEDGDVGADAEGKDEDGDQGEGAIAAKGAEGVFQILDKVQILEKDVEFHKSSRFTVLVFRLIETAKADKRLAAGFQGGEAQLDVFFDGHVEMGGDFGFQIGFELGLTKEGKYAGQAAAWRAH